MKQMSYHERLEYIRLRKHFRALLVFDTAWCPPYQWFRFVCFKYDKRLSFTLNYDVELGNGRGKLTSRQVLAGFAKLNANTCSENSS